MALTMLDKAAEKKDKSQWPAELTAEFAREANNPNPCVGSTLLSETERTRVWIIRLAPGERIGFHRHVLDYFWTAVRAAAAVSTCMTAPRSITPISRARPGTRATARANSRCTIWKISATAKWCS